MGITRGSISTPIIVDGLVFNMDAANRASYPRSGTTITETINSVAGTFNGSTFVNENNGIINFDGTDDYIDFSTPAATNAGTEKSSINVWVKTGTNVSNNQTIYSERDGSVHIFSKLRINTNTFDYIFLTPSTILVLSSTIGTPSTNSWYNICGTKNNNNFKIYVNGVLSNSSTTSMGSFTTTGTIFSYIGKEISGLYLSGNTASQQYYNRALSATEVLHNYNALKGRFGL